VIPMQQISSYVETVCGNTDFDNMVDLPALRPFDPSVVGFLDELSKVLLSHPEARRYPEVASFGFFCRKRAIEKRREPYETELPNLVGRGLVFHVAPSNVPVNFAYSLLAGLLAGNTCIVRLSTKEHRQSEIIYQAMDDLFCRSEFGAIAERISLIRYGHDANLNDYFSSLCAIRVLWGGDATISEIRKAPLKARAIDVTFADRVSLCAIDADAYIYSTEKQEIAERFFNDTFVFDQNACTSPRIICWIGAGETVKAARTEFWETLANVVREKKYSVEPSIAVEKLSAVYSAGMDLDNTTIIADEDGVITRVEVDHLKPALENYYFGGGVFFEYVSHDLTEIGDLLTDKYQTLTYYGLDPDSIADQVLESGARGIDRIVPVGRSSEFGLVWDGYDLIRSMARHVIVA